MNLTVDVQIACEDEEQPPPSKIEQWVLATLNHPGVPERDSAELTVRIVDEAESQALNHNYRDKPAPTNVLSFPADLPDHIKLPLLGDLVVCAAVVNREAREQHKIQSHHWAHMIVHGCLHLLGFDHIEDQQAQQMEALEVDILASLQIADPYSDHEPPHTVNLQEDRTQSHER